MKIKKIKSQTRRDFYAIYECEFCGYIYEGYGYDDAYFHNVVIHGKECPMCNKKSDESYRPLSTKFAEYEQV